MPVRMMTGKAQVELEQEQLTPCKTEVSVLSVLLSAISDDVTY
jgi:hypothetical protein